mgnify:CR=1 FL=1
MNHEEFVINDIAGRCMDYPKEKINRTLMLSSLPLGSLQVLEVVHEIETRFGIDVDENSLLELKSVGDLVDLVPDDR